MNDLLKKVSLASLMFVTVFTMSFGSFVPKVSAALAKGDLVKGPSSDAVYYIDGTMKHVFPDKKTYMTWYSNFDAVKKVTVSELDMYPTGAPVAYRPGTKLITHPNTAKVYAVEPGGGLRWVPSETIAKNLFGIDWAKRVRDVHELTFGNYIVGSDLSTMYPKGSLLKKSTEATVYYYDGTNLRSFSAGAFDANKFDAVNVVTADLSAYTMGSAITGADDAYTIAGAGTGTVSNVPAGTLTVALSPATPASGLAVENSARYPFTTLRVSTGNNPVTIDSMTVKRGGLGQDGAFSSVDVLDGTTMLPFDSNSKSFNSEHEAVFNKDIVIPANTTKDLVLSANMVAVLDGYAGEAPALGVTDIKLLGGSTMSGTLPIMGNTQTLNATIVIGSATVQRGSYTNATSTNLEVGRMGYTFFSFQVQAGSAEDTEMSSLMVYQEGTATLLSDFANFKLYRDATEIAVGTVDDKYIKFAFSPIMIPKGQTYQFQVKADIVSGSARTVDFGVYRTTDLLVKGKTYGYNITPTYSGTGSSTNRPVLSDNSFTIGNGTITIERSSTVGSNNITIGNGQTLGAFKFTVKGEPIEITAANLTIASSATGTIEDALQGVKLVDASGKIVAGPSDLTNNSLTVAWSDSFIVPVGESVYKVMGNLQSNGGWATNDTVTVTLGASSVTAEGTTTGNTIATVPSTSTSANPQTVKTAKLQVSRNTVPASQNVVAGKQDVTVGSWSFDASDSGEDVRITSVAFRTTSSNDILNTVGANLTVYVDGQAQSPVVDTTAVAANTLSTSTFALDNPIVVAKGTLKTVTLIIDILSGSTAPDQIRFGLTDATAATNASVVAYGVSTGNRASVTMNADDGAIFSVSNTGTVTVGTYNNPSSAIVRAGATGITLGYVKFDGYNEPLDLDNLSIFLANGAVTGAATGDYQDLSKVYVYDGATKLAEASVPSSNKYSWTFPNGTVTVPMEGSKILTIKADISTVSSSVDDNPGMPGVSVKLGFGGKTGFAFTGNDSNTAITAGSETYNGSTTSPMVLHKAVPTVTFSTSGNTLGAATALSNASIPLYAFRVSADAAGNEVLLYRATFEIATGGNAGLALTNCNLRDQNSNTIGAAASPTIVDGAPDYKTFTFNNPDVSAGNDSEAVTIPAGESRTYTMYCTISGATTGGTVSVSLLGDTASSTPAASHGSPSAAGQNTAAAYGAMNQGNFVWSDNYKNKGLATDGANATAYGQWYSGYLVTGLGTTATTTAYTVGWN